MKIFLHTPISAPIDRCFRLSLSVDLHKASTSDTNETAVAGVTSGLMKLHDFVTWEATHFGFRFRMTSYIPVYDAPNYFVSAMWRGPFKKMYHRHFFHAKGPGETVMTDEFEFEAPLGWLGKMAGKLFLEKHMRNLLINRNACIKTVAEGEAWKSYL